MCMYLVTLKYCLVYYLTDITTDNEKWERKYGKITALLFLSGDIPVSVSQLHAKECPGTCKLPMASLHSSSSRGYIDISLIQARLPTRSESGWLSGQYLHRVRLTVAVLSGHGYDC